MSTIWNDVSMLGGCAVKHLPQVSGVLPNGFGFGYPSFPKCVMRSHGKANFVLAVINWNYSTVMRGL